MGSTPNPEEEKKKREIFEAMSPKRQQRILKKGYDDWNPFQRPKEPFEQITRKGAGDLERALELYHRFFAERRMDDFCTAYVQGVNDICLGIIRGDDRYRGMYDFCCWYREKREEGR
jgi:hypothetical protein